MNRATESSPRDEAVEPRVKPKPSYAPVYAAALYPELATLVRTHGYALAVHGSLARDMDLICVPWTETPSDSIDVVEAITDTFCIRNLWPVEVKEHGREVYTLSIGFGECFIDLSFMPRVASKDQHATQVP